MLVVRTIDRLRINSRTVSKSVCVCVWSSNTCLIVFPLLTKDYTQHKFANDGGITGGPTGEFTLFPVCVCPLELTWREWIRARSDDDNPLWSSRATMLTPWYTGIYTYGADKVDTHTVWWERESRGRRSQFIAISRKTTRLLPKDAIYLYDVYYIVRWLFGAVLGVLARK